MAVIESAAVLVREPNDDGPRVMVMTHALCGAFIFTPDEAERRIRKAFPDLGDKAVARGVRHLGSLARIAVRNSPSSDRHPSWVRDYATLY